MCSFSPSARTDQTPLTAIDGGSGRGARSQATVMDQQAWDGQAEKMEMVLCAGRKKTWIGRFIFIALLRVSWENIIRSMFDASRLASSPLSFSYPLIDKNNKCNMIERLFSSCFKITCQMFPEHHTNTKLPWSEEPRTTVVSMYKVFHGKRVKQSRCFLQIHAPNSSCIKDYTQPNNVN